MAAIEALQDVIKKRVFASNLWTRTIAVLTDEDVKPAVDGDWSCSASRRSRGGAW